MADPFVGEIRMFAGNFAPKNWAFCDGQLVSVSACDALFSLLGTTYGGDGITSFGLPDLRGRLPVHFGTGPGLTPRPIGQRVGNERVTLQHSQTPSHNHSFIGSTQPATDVAINGRVFAKGLTDDMFYTSNTARTTTLIPETIESAGGGQSHSNIMPFLCIHFIIAMVGSYPSRN
jgi:microcystin-dependent protein